MMDRLVLQRLVTLNSVQVSIWQLTSNRDTSHDLLKTTIRSITTSSQQRQIDISCHIITYKLHISKRSVNFTIHQVNESEKQLHKKLEWQKLIENHDGHYVYVVRDVLRRVQKKIPWTLVFRRELCNVLNIQIWSLSFWNVFQLTEIWLVLIVDIFSDGYVCFARGSRHRQDVMRISRGSAKMDKHRQLDETSVVLFSKSESEFNTKIQEKPKIWKCRLIDDLCPVY